MRRNTDNNALLSETSTTACETFHSDGVSVQGGRRRRRQSGRRQQPTGHHLHRLQDVPEHRGQRQGRTCTHIHTHRHPHAHQADGECTCDELMTHSCLSPTGSPMHSQQAGAGAVCVRARVFLCVCVSGSRVLVCACEECPAMSERR